MTDDDLFEDVSDFGWVYGPGMHDAVLMELELGYRVALAQDTEDCYGAVFIVLWTMSE